MFGYVRIRKGDLRVKEYEFYKAVYCGLCHHQKKLSRRLRYTLSYDLVLLALIRMGVANETCCFLKKRCPIEIAFVHHFLSIVIGRVALSQGKVNL